MVRMLVGWKFAAKTVLHSFRTISVSRARLKPTSPAVGFRRVSEASFLRRRALCFPECSHDILGHQRFKNSFKQLWQQRRDSQ